jgi:hypothetical protein
VIQLQLGLYVAPARSLFVDVLSFEVLRPPEMAAR